MTRPWLVQVEKMLDALEELEDIADFDKAMARPDEGIPWEKVKKELGWE